jgi:hypothetical protein
MTHSQRISTSNTVPGHSRDRIPKTVNVKMKLAAWLTCLCLIPTIALAALTATERKSQFDRALSFIIASATPDIAPGERDRVIKAYGEAQPNKGLAVQDVYRGYFLLDLHEEQAFTGDRTLEGCQFHYARPCALIAINDEIASDGQLDYRDMPRLHYAGEFDLAQIPIIRQDTRNRADLQRYYNAPEPKAIAIHSWGELFIAVGSVDAQQTVLAKCGDFARDKQVGPCFLYAVSRQVVLPERRTQPK